MNQEKHKTIETQLDCRATAQLLTELALDLSMPDKSMSLVIEQNKEIEEKDESKNNREGSD
jgi:hypothetical protein